ncbi:MAG: hypothetical protein R3E31_19960 [Chloroflexota bacterium]
MKQQSIKKGNIRLIKPVALPPGHRVLVTVLEEPALDIAVTVERSLLAQA